MTISTVTSSIEYSGNGDLTIFAFNFPITDTSDINVSLDGVDITSFTVQYNIETQSGTVSISPAPASGVTIRIYRVIPLTQETDYNPYDPFPAQTHEAALDKLTMITQQLQENINEADARSVRLASDEEVTDAKTVLPSGRENSLLSFGPNQELTTQPFTLDNIELFARVTRTVTSGQTVIDFGAGVDPSIAAIFVNGLGVDQGRLIQFVDYTVSGTTITLLNTLPAGTTVTATVNVNIDTLGSAATADVTTSQGDTTVGRVLKVGDSGLNGLSLPLFSGDVDTLLSGTFSVSIDPTATNIPTAAFGILSVKMWQDDATGLQEFTTIDTGGGTRKFYRTRTASVWDNWVEIYQSDIFVVNSFGFLGSNTVIATGVATSATSATFYFPLNKTNFPAITVSGTFTIYSPNGVILQGGINSGNFNLSGNSSNRLARVTISAVSGLTTGDVVELRNVDSASGITF